MSKKLIVLACYVLLLGLATSVAEGTDPSLAGWWKFDEGSGTTANDSSGNENHGTFNGDPQWVNGKFGKALKFDGGSDYLDVPDSNSLDINGEQPRYQRRPVEHRCLDQWRKLVAGKTHCPKDSRRGSKSYLRIPGAAGSGARHTQYVRWRHHNTGGNGVTHQ